MKNETMADYEPSLNAKTLKTYRDPGHVAQRT
jgi:hypothetical protein